MPRRRLLPNRRAITAVIVATSGAAALLGLRYSGQDAPGRVDGTVDEHVRSHLAGYSPELKRILSLADPRPAVILAITAALIFAIWGRYRVAALAAIGPAVAAGLTELALKPLVGRRFNDALSFPSGHTTASVAVAAVVVIALLGPARPSWPAPLRWAGCAFVSLVAAAIATALVGAGYHYATDTIGGCCVAIAVILACARVIDTVADRPSPNDAT